MRLIGLPFAKETKESKEDVTLLHYLLKRILALRSISNHIKYDTIYQDLGYSNATLKKKFKIRQRTKEILNSWKGAFFGDVEILDYKEEKDGQVPKGIVIKFKVHKNREKEDDWE